MEEFFQNGFVLVIVMFLSAVVNLLCLQTHYFIGIIEGLNVRAAIQVKYQIKGGKRENVIN